MTTVADPKVVAEDLLGTFRNALAQPDFGAQESFLEAGGDSLTVVEVIFHVEAEYGVSLSAAEFMALASAERLAQHIVARQRELIASKAEAHALPASDRSALSVIQDGGQRDPLVCAYGVHGESAYAITLARLLPRGQPVAMLNLRTETVPSRGVPTLRKFAAGDAALVVNQFKARPCNLLGFSLGAHVALAIAHELGQRGVHPSILAVLDDDAELDRRNFGVLHQRTSPTDVATLLAHAKACSAAEPLAVHVVYFRSAEDAAFHRSDPTGGWSEIATGGVTVVDIPASHWSFVREPSLRHIAPRLAETIAAERPVSPAPDAARMLRFAARRAAREGDLPTELRCLKQTVREDRDQPSWLYANLAEALFQKGDMGAALGALAEARRRDPWPLTLDVRFLPVFEQRGLKEEQSQAILRLSAVRPDHPSVHCQLAEAYRLLGVRAEWERHVRAGLAEQPMHGQLSFLLLRHLRRQNAWPQLRQLGERIVAMLPGESEPRVALMEAYINLETPLAALQFRDAILSASPADVSGLLMLSAALIHGGCEKEALEVADLAVQHEPRSLLTQRQRAICLSALGRTAEATSAFQRAGLGAQSAAVPSHRRKQ